MNDEELFDKEYEKKSPDFNKHINIAVVGKVSSGKSSLINAILGYKRDDKGRCPVAAISGVTKYLRFYKLGDNVLIADCPGLADIRKENSAVTKNFLEYIDIGLFVVTGSADATQKADYDDLKRNTEIVIVVLNKIDDWKNKPSAYEKVKQQWQKDLGVTKIYGTCADGYDPDTDPNALIQLEGIEEVRDEMFKFLKTKGKDALLARHLRDKNYYANRIIAGALVLVAAEAFIPGSAVYITATQVATIGTLHYLYKGQPLSKASALGLIGIFAGQSIGMNTFLWVKSFLPPTGVVDIAAAAVAVVVTFAMLASVRWALENEYDFDKDQIEELKKVLKVKYAEFQKIGAKLKDILKDLSISDFTDKERMMTLIMKFLTSL
jgi:small GTP-binding protein